MTELLWIAVRYGFAVTESSIIEAHGGTITAENAPDRGARMIVRLPAVRGQTQTVAAA